MKYWTCFIIAVGVIVGYVSYDQGQTHKLNEIIIAPTSGPWLNSEPANVEPETPHQIIEK